MARYKNSIISPTTGELMHMLDLKIHEYPINCAYKIDLRIGSAKFKRQQTALRNQSAQLEKACESAKRRVNKEKFHVLSLIFHETLPSDSGCDQILASAATAQPGFCYRCNGTPRQRSSLVESETRQIVHDMNGKLGFFSQSAANVVSNNPMMAEVLSSPEIITTLCDLRITAAILEDKSTLKEFSSKFEHLESLDPNSVLALKRLHDNINAMMDGEDRENDFNEGAEARSQLIPVEYLRQYRKNLLLDFFELLQEKAEIRLSSGLSRNTALRYLWSAPNKLAGQLSAGQRIIGENKPPISVREWNKILVARLQKAKDSESVPKNSKPKWFASLASSRLRESGNAGGRTPTPAKPPAKSATSSKQSKKPVSQAGEHTKSTKTGTRHSEKSTNENFGMRKAARQRSEFNGLMKDLINEIDKMEAAERTYIDVHHKNPAHAKTTAQHAKLLKLLKKRSLFSTLNEDDLIFCQFEGGREAAADLFANQLLKFKGRQLNASSQQKRTGAEGYKSTPNRSSGSQSVNSPSTSTQMKSSLSDEGQTRETQTPANSFGSTDLSLNCNSPITTRTWDASSGSRFWSRSSAGSTRKTMKRLFCPACTAKIQQTCLAFRKRDIKDQVQNQKDFWKLSGYAYEWGKRPATAEIANDKLLLAIPATNYGEMLNNFPPPTTSMKAINKIIKSSKISKYVPNRPKILQPRLTFSPPNDEMKIINAIERAISASKTPMFPGFNFPADLLAEIEMETTKPLTGSSGPGPQYGTSFTTMRSSIGTGTLSTTDILKQRKRRKLINPNSWTLKVSTRDIMRLRNEIEIEKLGIKLRMAGDMY